ncbi:hypothetical protein ACIQPR_07550 [Streptomyces sp. NPDC091280]|uniref:hypothetical protein n=1 Tax=Streptomyces sp. NPDC091280 TaxID=3365984 RepID=UPI0037F3FC54
MPTYDHAVALRFTDSAAAHRAFNTLVGLDSAATEIRGAALIERVDDGTIRVPMTVEHHQRHEGAGDGLLDTLLGLLGGPLGAALGWGIGAVLADHDQRPAAGAIEAFTPHVPHGGTAVLAEVGESDPEILDLLAMDYDAVLERRPAATVRAELAALAAEAEAIRRRRANGRAEHGPTGTAQAA